jgi:putative NADPH-quinone reductase
VDSRRILILQGHPDPSEARFGRALAQAYAHGARGAGHEVRTVDVGRIDFPLLRTQEEWKHGVLPSALLEAQQAIGWAGHLVLFFPLWMGDMPALLKGFLEQVLRPGFALKEVDGASFGHKALQGRSARVVVTMGMPALVYRWYFRAHSVRALERNILGLVGIAPVHETLVGQIDGLDDAARQAWLKRLEALGRRAD